jgi:uncharacterized protein YdcH (DUF465 family)
MIEQLPGSLEQHNESNGQPKRDVLEKPGSLEGSQREYAKAWLDFSFAHAQLSSARKQERSQYWKLLADRKNPDLLKEHEKLNQMVAEQEKSQEEVAERQSSALDKIIEIGGSNNAKANAEGANRFITEEMLARIEGDPESVRATFQDDPEIIRLIEQVQKLGDSLKERQEKIDIIQGTFRN